MKLPLALIPLLALAAPLHAAAPSDRFLTTLAHIESSGRPGALGDAGRARGLYQFQEPAWVETTTLRRRAGLPSAPWHTGAHHPSLSTAYARTWLDDLDRRLRRALRRPPTHAELYATWNLGYDGFRRCRFQLHRTPLLTRTKARHF